MTKKKQNEATINQTNNNHLLFTPERKVVDTQEAEKMVLRCAEYNSSRSDARNFRCMEFKGIKFVGEDLSNIEAHYSHFEDVEFVNCKLSGMEAYFSSWHNVIFTNCEISNCNFSFAEIANCSVFNSNLNGTDFPFARGNFGVNGSMMENVTCNNATLQLHLVNANARGFEGNCSKIDFAECTGCNLRRAELNDSTVTGNITNSCLVNAELNRSDISGLEIGEDCATSGMETEDSSVNIDFDKALDEALSELEEGLED